eukprot:TRINITY_DN250_c0_g2_i5.p1 TRINITY_DN250_c0_g2~~TRINITY_DN250_c0_g2_i5.p1  ORF type:complete len:188 (-),score=26.81 TRINITY_DN250_c0_g2_i5:89-652(-)
MSYYRQHYGDFRYRRDAYNKARFWSSEYPVEKAITTSKLGVFPAQYGQDWEPLPVPAEKLPLESWEDGGDGVGRWCVCRLLAPQEAPSPAKMIHEEIAMGDSIQEMLQCGRTTAARIMSDRLEEKAGEADVARRRLDAPYAFGQAAPSEYQYQLTNRYRGRSNRPELLYGRADSQPSRMYATQGHVL